MPSTARPSGAPAVRLPAPTGLPVEEVVGPLVEALGRRGVAVLVAEPGAGKTTVVPLRLLAAPWLAGGRIVLLEPRRVAARAAAARMAALVGGSVGGTVGLRTRDETRVGPDTRLEVVTEGVLTRMVQADPSLEGVGLVVFDEFHERSLHADLGLALALEVRRELREDLRVLVASATIDADRVAALLASPGDEPAPVLAAAGRTHPVDLRWQPPPAPVAGRPSRRGPDVPDAAVAAAAADALAAQDGDVLVFLPGAAAIRRVGRLLGRPGAGTAAAQSDGRPVDVRPLFGALPPAEQDLALAPSPPGRRRIVLATDLAETSLTVEGVGAVVDSGLARVPRLDPRSGMTRLVTVRISRASADQRAGRAGRTGPGLAIRLWSPGDHATRRPHAEPAITQVDLTALALELALWGADASGAAFLDPPPAAALDHGRRVLVQLGALDEDGRPTPRGRAIAGLPLHPRLARMVLAGRDAGQGWTACLLAALLDERDVLGGRPDEVPTDLALRLRLLDGDGGHPLLDRAAAARVRDRARDLARRAGVRAGPVAGDGVGVLVAAAYPDRVARARDGGGGRFRLAAGGGAWMAAHDELAGEAMVVAADLDGDRRDARIRLAAALDEAELIAASPVPVAERRRLVWGRDRDDLALEVVRHLDGVELATRLERPPPGPPTTAALVDHVARAGLDALGWTEGGRAARDRLAFLHAHRSDEWPDVGDDALLATLDTWLAPMLPLATGRADLAAVDPGALLVRSLDHHHRRDLDRLAPATLALPSGRDVRVDYASGDPVVAVAPQELFGSADNPSVLDGEVPVVLHLLSPAGRPVQVTADLPGFWAGSWSAVRKEMAGRYPKHPWPEDPLTASPRRPGGGRRRQS